MTGGLNLLKRNEIPQRCVEAIAKSGGHTEFTLLPDRDHYILDVYNRPDLYKWLAEQRRKPTE